MEGSGEGMHTLFEEVDALNRSSSGKAPARATLPLVLDACDCPSGHPVHRSGVGHGGGTLHNLGGFGCSKSSCAIEVGAEHESTVLSVGEVCEYCGSN